MQQLITASVCLCLFLIYLKIKEKANKKYGNSVFFRMINEVYNKWYTKRRQGASINKGNRTMFELDRAIYNLKQEYEKRGISKEDIEEYLKFENSKVKGNKFIDMFTLGGTFYGINSIKNVVNTETLFKDWIPNISNVKDFISSHKDSVIDILYILLFFFFIFMLFKISYKLINIDSMHKDSQKITILNKVIKIWNYDVDENVTRMKDIENHEQKEKCVYPNLKPDVTKFERDLKEVFGDTFNNYLQLVIEFFKVKQILRGFYKIVLKSVFPMMIFIICLLIEYFFINIDKTIIKSIFPIVMIALICIIYWAIYCSQVDKIETKKTAPVLAAQTPAVTQTSIVETNDKKVEDSECENSLTEKKYKLVRRKRPSLESICLAVWLIIVQIIITYVAYALVGKSLIWTIVIILINIVGLLMEVEKIR